MKYLFFFLVLLINPATAQWRPIHVSSSTDVQSIEENFRRASLYSGRKLDRFSNDTVYGQPIFRNGVKFLDNTIQTTAISSTAYVTKTGDTMTGNLIVSNSSVAVTGVGIFQGSGAGLTNLSTVTYLADDTSLALTGATFSAKASSVTLQGPVVSSITLSAMYGTPTLTGTNITGIPPAGVTGTAAILGANTFTGAQTFPGSGIWNASGNVGIGAVAPVQKLEVVNVGASNVVFRTSVNTSYASLRLQNDLNSTLRMMDIAYSGSGYGGALIAGGPTGEIGYIATNSTHPFVIGTNATARLTVTGSGNVGIGTTAPAVALDVVGFTRLGDNANAPKIKMVRVSTTTGNAGGEYSQVAHGVTASKIIGAQYFIDGLAVGASMPPGITQPVNFQYTAYFESTYCVFRLQDTNSATLYNKTAVCLFFYIE